MLKAFAAKFGPAASGRSSRWPACRKFTQKRAPRMSIGKIVALRLTTISNDGGSIDTEATAVIVIAPQSLPSLAVTTATAFTRERIAWR